LSLLPLNSNDAGLNCSGRLFISDRAHLVFDFHQIVDGLKEVELGGSSCAFPMFWLWGLTQLMGIIYSIGTTKKGIGPAYSAKASRSGLRVHHLFDPTFADKFRKIVEGRYKRYGHFEYDTEGEIERYKVRFSSASLPPPPRVSMLDVTHFPNTRLHRDWQKGCALSSLTVSCIYTRRSPRESASLSRARTL
jgi:hypothetical protein